MILANEKHLTLVCYRGGYGGDFFCAMLDEAFGNLPFRVRDANNRYWSKNYALGSIGQIKNLQLVFEHYYKDKVLDELTDKLEWADEIKRVFDLCYHEDDVEFKSNVLYFLSSNLHLPFKNNVASLHYNVRYSDFDIRKIHNNTSVIFLNTENNLYHQYFDALSQIKTNFNLLKNSSYRKKDRMHWKPMHYAAEIDVGKLYFEESMDDEISLILSDILKTKVVINLDELKDYKRRNDLILKRYIGDGYMNMNEEEFKSAKRRLFDKVINGQTY